MSNESPQAEMLRLRQEQAQARRNEIFGGLTSEERAAYEIKQKRLRELEHQLFNLNECSTRRKFPPSPHSSGPTTFIRLSTWVCSKREFSKAIVTCRLMKNTA